MSHREKNTKLLILLTITFLCLVSLLSRLLLRSVSEYLSKTERVQANILLIEGWLPVQYIELAYDEFYKNGYEHIVTTGQRMPEYYTVPMNGYLIFSPSNSLTGYNSIGNHYIEVDVYSELEEENRAHFNLYINDSLLADFYADRKKKKFGINWERPLSEIDSIAVQFTNDGVGDYGDRNLYVKEVIIDNDIRIPYPNNSEYDIATLDGKQRIRNNYNSYAELARNRLLEKGMDSSVVTAVLSERVKINRTLTSALAFRNWLEGSDYEVEGINIISLGVHARRTHMSYKKVLGKSYNIGIISLPNQGSSLSRQYEILNIIRETIGIIYYWFILNLY